MRLIQTHVKTLAIANQNSPIFKFAKTSTKATFKQIIELRVMVCVMKVKNNSSNSILHFCSSRIELLEKQLKPFISSEENSDE